MDELQKIKEDKEALKELKNKEIEAFDQENLILLYDLLDTYLALDIEAESIDRLYQKILEIAFERLTEKLTQGEVFDLTHEEDLYTARAIYEHALERWDAKDFKGANELFLVMSYLVQEDSIKKSLLVGLGLTAQKKSLDHFIEHFVDKEGLGEESFFFNALLPFADNYLKENAALIEEELAKIRKLAR